MHQLQKNQASLFTSKEVAPIKKNLSTSWQRSFAHTMRKVPSNETILQLYTYQKSVDGDSRFLNCII